MQVLARTLACVLPQTLFIILVCQPSSAWAQGDTSAKAPSRYDKIWKFATIYDSKANRVVQQVLFTGRFQEDYADVDADQGQASEWNLRRLRLGPRLTLFRKLTVHAEVELNPQENDPTYVRMTDAYVAWAHSSRLTFTAGKHSVPFTSDGATSSKELITVDRSNLTNNIWFTQEYAPGVSVSGRGTAWTYRAGVYSSGAANREFGEFSGGVFTLGIVSYNFARKLDVKEATVTGNYVYQQPDVQNTFTRRHEHIVSIHTRFEEGRWGLRSDLSMTKGYLGQRDLWGVMAMPFFNVTPRLQIVGRYTFLDSDGTNGLQLGTYENRVVTNGRGDRYTEGYAGVNYYFYGHKLKLQSGLAWADMRDEANDGGAYHGRSWTTGLRIGW
jgi:phosphate-selective porin OprO/OprP